MKQTEYLEGVLNYYRECDITPGDPNEGRWEDAHTPYPRGMGESTVPLLHEHHVIHDLWQSEELGECHFYAANANKVLYSPNYWPKGWFELCEISDTFFQKLCEYAKEKSLSSQKSTQSRIDNARKMGKRFGSQNGKKNAPKIQETCRERGVGLWDPEVRLKGSKIGNSMRYECLVTGYQSTAGGLACYQKKRGIDTKLRKRIK